MGGIASNTCNVEVCELFMEGAPYGQYMVTGCNEVVNFINLNTNEIRYKIYDPEAQYGFVTCLRASGKLLAIGYSSGTILVYELDLAQTAPDQDNKDIMLFDLAHKFNFHRSGVSCILFDDNNTTMYSGGQDTYIVVYDLVSDTAQYKLMGHKEQIT